MLLYNYNLFLLLFLNNHLLSFHIVPILIFYLDYLNLNNIISSSDWDKLSESNKIFNGQWFIPAILIVKNGKIIDYKMEELSESDLINFLKENNL